MSGRLSPGDGEYQCPQIDFQFDVIAQRISGCLRRRRESAVISNAADERTTTTSPGPSPTDVRWRQQQWWRWKQRRLRIIPIRNNYVSLCITISLLNGVCSAPTPPTNIIFLTHSGYFCSASSRHSTDTVPEIHAEALQATVSDGLAQGSYLAARAGFKPTSLRTKGVDSANAPPTPHTFNVPSDLSHQLLTPPRPLRFSK